MSKYVNVLSDVEGLFATSAWTTNNISAFPSNLTVPTNTSEFVKIEVLPLSSNSDYKRFGLEGKIFIQTYVQANKGVKRLMEIADLLDNILQNKTLSNGTQTQSSSLQTIGIDRDNPELFRGDYTVDFVFYN
jgi:hypothetical protein